MAYENLSFDIVREHYRGSVDPVWHQHTRMREVRDYDIGFVRSRLSGASIDVSWLLNAAIRIVTFVIAAQMGSLGQFIAIVWSHDWRNDRRELGSRTFDLCPLII